MSTPVLPHIFLFVPTDPDQYTQIPFKAKALKIILKDLEQSIEATEPEESPHDDEVGPSISLAEAIWLNMIPWQAGDEEWEDDEDAEAAKGALDLSRKQTSIPVLTKGTKTIRISRFYRRICFIPERGRRG